jgi:septum formation inhibitor MinC
MSDPHALSPEQRRQAADILCAQVRSWMEDPESTFTISVRRGLYARMNLATGVREMHPNGTATVVLEVNGGARDVTDRDVLPVPGVVG